MSTPEPKQREKTIRGLAHWIASQANGKQYILAMEALTEHEHFMNHPVKTKADLQHRQRFIDALNREGIFIKCATVSNALASAIRAIQIAERMVYAAEFN